MLDVACPLSRLGVGCLGTKSAPTFNSSWQNSMPYAQLRCYSCGRGPFSWDMAGGCGGFSRIATDFVACFYAPRHGQPICLGTIKLINIIFAHDMCWPFVTPFSEQTNSQGLKISPISSLSCGGFTGALFHGSARRIRGEALPPKSGPSVRHVLHGAGGGPIQRWGFPFVFRSNAVNFVVSYKWVLQCKKNIN